MEMGIFISFEGVDGCGKSTQVHRLLETLSNLGYETVLVREPGGTLLGEEIRQILLDVRESNMVPEAEMLLFEASRAQLVRETIIPALERGAVVVSDRFADSTVAYQACARGLDLPLVDAANDLGTCGVWPPRTIVLDIDPETAYMRGCAGQPDRMEIDGVAFQARVREGYRMLAEREPNRVHLIDADGTPDEVWQRIVCDLSDCIEDLVNTK